MSSFVGTLQNETLGAALELFQLKIKQFPPVLSDYLRPLCKYEYSISDTQKFPSMLFSIPPLQDDGENLSYDVKSLFRNITLEETINYIKQIYVHIKLTPVCLKLNFGRLLMKLATECTLKFNDRFFRQVDCGTL